MTTIYTKEQIAKMKSSKMIDLILALQEERSQADSLHEQSLKHLNMSYKEQVEVQKELIQDLLKSEESLKTQLQQIQEKYKQLQIQKQQKNEIQEMKSNNFNRPNMNVNFGESSTQLKLFIQANDLKNSCIIEEEEFKTDLEEQQLFSVSSVKSDHYEEQQQYYSASKVKDYTPSRRGQELKSGQNLNFSSLQQQNIYPSKQAKNSNIRSGNDYLYKSIQSSNYIISPSDNPSDHFMYSQIEVPEQITNPLQKNRSDNPSRILLESRLDIPMQNINKQQKQQQQATQNISIIITEPKESAKNNYNGLNGGGGISCTNKSIQLSMIECQSKKGNKSTPIIESRRNKESLIASSQYDVHQQGQFTANILQSQYLYVSNQPTPLSANASPTHQQQVNIGDFLFEDFFIIGPSISEMKNIAQNSSETVNGTVEPDIYLSFPGQKDNSALNQRQSLKNFCFPHNVEFKKHMVHDLSNGKVDDILNLQIFKANVSKNSPNSFVFSMLGETERSQDKSILNPVLVSANPQLSLYCICFTTENFITIPSMEGGTKEEENCVYLAPISYCFMSYYPFINFFLDIISEIANQLKVLRANQYIKLFSLIDSNKCSYCTNSNNQSYKQSSNHQINKQSNNKDLKSQIITDQKSTLFPIEERISEQSMGDCLSQSDLQNRNLQGTCTCSKKSILSKILELDIENEIKNFQSSQFDTIRQAIIKTQRLVPDYSLELQLKFRLESEFIIKNYMVPAYNRIVQIEAEWGACLTMSCLPLEEFLFIFTAICLENRLVFFSQNIALLTSTILTFYSILKPMPYVLPVIFNVPKALLDLLEAPVPLILGFNKSIAYKTQLEEKGYSFEDKVVVDLDSSTVTCGSVQLREFIEKHMPLFKCNQQDLIEKYFFINARPSNQLKIFNSIRKKRNSLTNQGEQLASLRNQDNLLYQTTPNQYNAMTDFFECFRKCVSKYFIDHLPSKTEQFVSQFDIKNIQNLIVSKSKDDYEFVKEFVKTQIFTSYVETLYLTSL